MNIFRLLGDFSHLVAILILLRKIWYSKSCSGISGKTQVLFALVYTARYTNLTFYISSYNTLMKVVFLATSYATVSLIYIKFHNTYDKNHDTFRIESLLIPTFILALIFNYKFDLLEILWTFSIYLESVAIVPQLYMIIKTGDAEKIILNYVFVLGLYRGMYIFNWVYRYGMERHSDPISTVSGIVQVILYCEFFHLYINMTKKVSFSSAALLVISNPSQIGKVLSSTDNIVKHKLYIQLLSALTEPFGHYHPNVFTPWPKCSKIIFEIYCQVSKYCSNVDVYILLSGLKYNIPQIKTKTPIDLVIFDKKYIKEEIENFIKGKVENVSSNYKVLTIECDEFREVSEKESKEEMCVKHAVVGGTFDRLHLAHKLLLTEAALRANSKVTIGVTDENMISGNLFLVQEMNIYNNLLGKLLWELIQDIEVRMENVRQFLTEICPELDYDIVKIGNPYGPAIIDSTIDLIVVSEETLRGGQKINEIRKQRNLNELEIVCVGLIDEPNQNLIEEKKISSSTTRIRLLGTLLKPVETNNNIPQKPYIIGLTGGIASGKTGVAKHLADLGIQVINCDQLGHYLYQTGKPCHSLIVNHFGKQVLDSNGEIDRKALGSIVFKNPDELKKLNELVWPALMNEVKTIISNSKMDIIVIEAAVLLTAGWQKCCHEIWTVLIPKDEAIKRLISRDNLTEEQAKSRLDAQPGNIEYARAANVVFSTLWMTECTKDQVVKAWSLLQMRLPRIDTNKIIV